MEAVGNAHRIAPVACGCALVAAAAVVALNDPAAPGSWFPPCVFHRATGLWCPGCGLTRAAHALLTGHPLQALGYNLFAPLVFVAIGLSWLTWTRQAFGRPMVNPIMRLSSRAHTGLIVAIVVFGVVRNIPAAPFRGLAP